MQPPGEPSLEQRLYRLAYEKLRPEHQPNPSIQSRLHRARTNLEGFTTFTKPDFEVNWHHRVLLERLDDLAEGRITRLMVFSPPQHGKALALGTPIPTPDGFVPIEALRPGDTVFGADGKPCRIVACSPVWMDRPVWEVEDDTGCSVLADGEHIWRVRLDRKWKAFTLCSTAYLANRTSGRNPLVEVQGSLCLPEVPLPVDPYVLGVWLGDGTSAHATVAQGQEDIAFLRAGVQRRGYPTTDPGTEGTFGILHLHGLLDAAGLLRARRIPPAYLRSSARQRLELLQGLIDTDGHVAPDGQVEFRSMNRSLAESVQELVFSLGCKASSNLGYAAVNGKDCGVEYRVLFYLAEAALLPRKRQRCRNAAIEPNRYLRLRPAGRADTRCIQVDAPDGMFLCGRNFLPTHNSECVSRRFPAYVLGRWPDTPIISASYGDSLASLMNRDVQRIIDSDPYQQLFPGTQLHSKNIRTMARGNWLRNSDIFEVVNRRGSYRSAGVGSGIGGMPFQLGIIDDPYKDYREANSPTIREAVWNWYTTVFSARKAEAGARILITLTRWHMDDLAGRLLDMARSDPRADQWVVVEFPAILESEDLRQSYDTRKLDEALWEKRHPRKELEVEKIQAGPVQWSAVYQQRPSPARGTIFRREYFRYFISQRQPTPMNPHELLLTLLPPEGSDVPPRRCLASECTWFQTVDPADTMKLSSAFTCVLTIARSPWRDLLVFHCWRAKLPFPLRYQAITSMRQGLAPWMEEAQSFLKTLLIPWPRPLLYQAMENKASGISMIQQGAADGLPFRPLNPGSQSKVERCGPVSTLYVNGQVYHHRAQSWLGSFENEILTFPSGACADQVDCLAYAGMLLLQDALLGGNQGEELILWPDAMPRDSQGRILTTEHPYLPEEQQQEFTVGGTRVVFRDEEDLWE